MWERSAALERSAIAVALLLLVWGIGSFGIWDPWELSFAETARALGSGDEHGSGVTLTTRLIGASFDLFGAHEWSGRLPGVVAAVSTCMLAFVLVRRLDGVRAAAASVVILASTPMFLLDARLMMGAAIEVLAQTWVGVAALFAFLGPTGGRRRLWADASLALGLVVSTSASGVLAGPLPPILAVGAWALLSEKHGHESRARRWSFPALAALLLVGVLRAIHLDDPAHSVWLGGGAVGGDPPSLEKAGEVIFHGFAPWSAALPIAALWAIAPREGRPMPTQAAARVLVLWAAFGYVAWTVFASRYGTPAFLAQVPLAALVAMWLADIVRDQRARWTGAVVVALLTLLLIRDYVLYPNSPLRTLRVDGMDVPEVYDPSTAWSVVLALVAASISIALVSHDGLARPDAARAARWVRDSWRARGVRRGWLLLAAGLAAAMLSFGLACWVVDLPVASVAVRVGRILFFVPILVVLAAMGLPWLRWLYGKLGDLRAVPVLASGLAAAAFVSLWFQPALSRHFSPKPVYETYVELTEGRAEPLATYNVSSTAARYYTTTTATPIESRPELEAFLEAADGQRWAVIEADELPALDRAFRRKTGRHLYVADAQSALLSLIAAEPVRGRPNQSFLATSVLERAPEPQRPIGANYDDRIELVGYDLDLPGGDSVGAGQRFEITWYWRTLAESPTSQKVFVHIDGFGLRLNGDHVPVDGKYPTNLWLEGDVIVDAQTLTVPANYRNGDYTIYVGLFRGNKRLVVKSGPSDDANRVDAGILRIR